MPHPILIASGIIEATERLARLTGQAHPDWDYEPLTDEELQSMYEYELHNPSSHLSKV